MKTGPRGRPDIASEGLAPEDAAFAAQLRQLLDDTDKPPDYVTSSRLAAARARAVAAAGRRPTARWWWALPTTVAAAALLAVTLLRAPTPALPAHALAQSEAIELLGEEGEALAMYEDMDFYQWLAENDGA